MLLLSLMLLGTVVEHEARGQIAALTWSADDTRVLVVSVDGRWDEFRSSGELLRSGQASLKPGFKLVDGVAFSPDGTMWSALFIDWANGSGKTSVFTYEWGRAAPKSEFPEFTRNGQSLVWWGTRLVLNTDGDGVWLLGGAARPARVCEGSYGVVAAGNALMCNQSTECWTAPKGGRFICDRQQPGATVVLKFDIRSTERSGAIEHQVEFPLAPGESVLVSDGFSPDGATFALTTVNRLEKPEKVSHIVVRLADGRVARQPRASTILEQQRTYALSTLFVGSTGKPLRVWPTQLQSSRLPVVQLSDETYLVGAGNELYRLDLAQKSLKRLMEASPTIPVVTALGVDAKGRVLVLGGSGVARLVDGKLTTLRANDDSLASALPSRDGRRLAMWNPLGTRYAVVDL